MKSIPAASAMRASRRQSGQLADHRSATVVAERPDEQLAPNRPILSRLPLYIARRFGNEASRAGNGVSVLSVERHRGECESATKQSPAGARLAEIASSLRSSQ